MTFSTPISGGSAATGPLATEAKQDLIIADLEKNNSKQDYQFSNIDESTAVTYIGYEAPTSGAWYIKRWNEATGVMDFVGGAAGYAAAWTGRTGQTYVSASAAGIT